MKKFLHYIFYTSCIASMTIAQDVDNSAIMVRLATYNIRREGTEKKGVQHLWKNRQEQMIDLLKRINPDIIGMQEATASQIEDIKKALPIFAAIGQGRGSSWGNLGTNEYNPIFYKTDTFEKIEDGTFFINKIDRSWFPFWTPFDRQQTGWLPRICTWVKFKHLKTNKEFYVYNTHLDDRWDLARERGAQTIRKQMGNKKPIFFMGDFNTEFTNYLRNAFDNFDHAQEKAQQVSGPQETRTGWDDEELKTIDHILIQKDTPVKVLTYEVIQENKPYSSDHRPVVAEIELQ